MNKLVSSISSIVLAGLLMLLTVGLPITYNSVNKIKSDISQGKTKTNDNTNPYSNSTEEKTPSNGSLGISEEYVHEAHYDVHLSPFQVSEAYIHAHEATYVAYHGELHCPPPNNALV